MRDLRSAIFIGLTLCDLGCSSKNSGGSRDNPPQNPGQPQSKEEAVANLPPQYRENFDSWKQKVVKSCSATAVLGVNSDRMEAEGIDGAALLRSNNNSSIFSDDSQVAVVSSYNLFSGVAASKLEKSEEVNGRGYKILAETRREGTRCSVFFYGQKVHETDIVESVQIGAHWTTSKTASVTSPVPQVKNVGATGMGEVSSLGLRDVLLKTLAPTKDVTAMFAKRYSLSDAQSANLFRFGSNILSDAIVKIDQESSAAWSNVRQGQFIASSATLTRFFGATADFPVEVRFAMPSLKFSDISNQAEAGNLKLNLNLSTKTSGNELALTTQAPFSHAVTPFDSNEAIECAKSRTLSYVIGTLDRQSLQPSVPFVFEPCLTLHPEVENESYRSGLMKSLIPVMFAGVIPARSVNYQGWDNVLSKLARDTLEQGKDIISELDPNLKTQIVPVIASRLASLRNELEQTKNRSLLQDAVFNMGLTWSFSGVSVAPDRVSQMIRAADNSIETFKVSTERFLNTRAQTPELADEQINFALQIDPEYKAEAIAALSLAHALDYQSFEADVFNSIIQKQVPLSELKVWKVTLGGIKNETEKYPALASVLGSIVGFSVKHLQSGSVGLQELSGVYAALSNSFVPFEGSTKELIRALDESVGENKEATDFAAALSPEYKQMSLEIREKTKTLEMVDLGESFFSKVLQVRPSLDKVRALNETTSAALAFTQREKAKTAGEFGSSNDSELKEFVKTAWNELWTNSEFSQLETVAELAKAKSFCERLKGASSLADCGSRRLFSKSKGQFFDPDFAGRYVSLSTAFIGFMNQLLGIGFSSLRLSLLDSFFGSQPIWQKCDTAAFNQKSSQLSAQVSAIKNTNDQFKKWDIEREIGKTLGNCL